MCEFCDKIYPDEDIDDIVFGRGKYSNIRFGDKPFITIDKEGHYNINADPDDPLQMGTIFSIKYCPYCGRDLAESESKRYMEMAKSYVQGLRAAIENDWQLKLYPSSQFSRGLRRALEIIDKYKPESEE